MVWEEGDLKPQLEFWLPTTALLLFNHSLKPAAKSVFTTLFPNHVLIVTAIDVPVIDAFFHSSIIFTLQ